MPTILHLGILDVPYVDAPPAAKPGRKPPKAKPNQVTTGDVAEWLENRYHVMEVFFELRKETVADALAESVGGAIEDLFLGAPIGIDAFGAGTSKIEEEFKKFLDSRAIEGIGYPGVPTKAALEGVNHRLKLRRGPRRPSFVDTGLYQSSFKAWVDSE